MRDREVQRGEGVYAVRKQVGRGGREQQERAQCLTQGGEGEGTDEGVIGQIRVWVGKREGQEG